MDATDRRTAPGSEPGAATVDPGPVHPAGHSGTDANGSAPHAASAGEAFAVIGRLFAELREYATYYISATLDGYKVAARNIGIYAALGVLALFVAVTVVVTAVVLLLVGASVGIGKAFEPDMPWLGAIIVGVVILGGLAAGVIFGMRWLTGTSRAALVRKYEERQRQQREQFGRDVRGREADPATADARR